VHEYLKSRTTIGVAMNFSHSTLHDRYTIVKHNLNCWEAKRCGRQLGGSRENELGPCPASTAGECDGINHGKNGGRFCWNIVATLCDHKLLGNFAGKNLKCKDCAFYRRVQQDEDDAFRQS
jgi:hypothetical protein